MTHRQVRLEYVVVPVLLLAVLLAVGLLGAVAGVRAEDVIELKHGKDGTVVENKTFRKCKHT